MMAAEAFFYLTITVLEGAPNVYGPWNTLTACHADQAAYAMEAGVASQCYGDAGADAEAARADVVEEEQP